MYKIYEYGLRELDKGSPVFLTIEIREESGQTQKVVEAELFGVALQVERTAPPPVFSKFDPSHPYRIGPDDVTLTIKGTVKPVIPPPAKPAEGVSEFTIRGERRQIGETLLVHFRSGKTDVVQIDGRDFRHKDRINVHSLTTKALYQIFEHTGVSPDGRIVVGNRPPFHADT